MEIWATVLFLGMWIAVNWEKGLLWNLKFIGLILAALAGGVIILIFLTGILSWLEW